MFIALSTCRRQAGLLLMTQRGLVPRLQRSDHLRYRFPALPGWAHIWWSALRALHPWRLLPCHFSLDLPQASQRAPYDRSRGWVRNNQAFVADEEHTSFWGGWARNKMQVQQNQRESQNGRSAGAAESTLSGLF
jgi:hypothetical protein